jgi:hypothetical protein
MANISKRRMRRERGKSRGKRRNLSGVLAKFAKFSPDFMAKGRGDQNQAERDAAIDSLLLKALDLPYEP